LCLWGCYWRHSANIAGAVFGCLLAGFYLLRVFDMAVATYVAVSINAGIALVSFAASLTASARGLREGAREGDKSSQIFTPSRYTEGEGRRIVLVYIAIALS